MTTLRTVIADDETLARKLLRALLEKSPEIRVIAECKNGSETIQTVQDLTPDLLFLDIHMPGTSGFDVVKRLQSDIMPIVIFCTAHQRFALDVFDRHAVDYVLKPLDEALLQRVIQRVTGRFEYSHDLEGKKSALIAAIMEIDELMKKLDEEPVEEQVGGDFILDLPSDLELETEDRQYPWQQPLKP